MFDLGIVLRLGHTPIMMGAHSPLNDLLVCQLIACTMDAL